MTLPPLDLSTFELAGVTLKLRDGVVCWTRDDDQREPTFVVEDLKTGRFFRVGLAEYTLLSLFDGRQTLGGALAESARFLGGDTLTETEAASMCRWLIEQDLVTTAASESVARLLHRDQERQRHSYFRWLNPVMLQFPICSPDGLFLGLNRLMGWSISLPLLAVWCIVCGWGLFSVLTDWSRFSGQSGNVLDQHNWLALVATSVGLKLMHEIAHGLCCRRFGGEVRSCGVLLLMFLPLPFVDVTSSQRFLSRGSRMLVAAAGMLCEFLIAAVAAIVWRNTTSPVLSMHMVNVIVSASVTTLLFNANPLMRFDGYHLLVDWLHLPNLSTRGRAWVNGMLAAIFLGERRPVSPWKDRREWLIPLYGVASVVWMMLVSISITAGAANLLPGVGIVLASISAGLWLLLPTWRFLVRLVKQRRQVKWQWVRCGGMTSLLVTALWIGSGALPAPRGQQVPCVIDFEPRYDVRAGVAGFVEEVSVSAGANVKQGDLLLRLVNPQLSADAEELELSLTESRLKYRLHQLRGEVALALAEREHQQAITARLAELSRLLDQLEVRAPGDGWLLDAGWEGLPGRYCAQGELLATVGSNGAKQAILLIPQHIAPRLATSALETLPMTEDDDRTTQSDAVGQTEQTVFISLEGMGGRSLEGQWKLLEPSATSQLPHPALGAPGGGPLAMRPITGKRESDPDWELIDPHLLGRVTLSPTDSHLLSAGQTGLASLASRPEPLRAYLHRNLQQWFEEKFTESHGL
ncbi:MAG: hypothetical protein R3C01_16735 [Planctomycetaceae bacterium]